MLFNLINLMMILPLFFIYTYFLVMATKGKHQIYLGVTLPYGVEEREEVQGIFSSFKKTLLLVTLVSSVILVLLTFLIKDMLISISMTYSLVLLFLFIQNIIYIHYHKKLKGFVDKHHLHPEKETEPLMDRDVLGEKKASMKWPIYLFMILPQLVSLYILREDPLFFLGVILTLTSLLVPVMDYAFSRMPLPLLYERPEANRLYEKIYQQGFKRFSYGYTFLTMLLSLSVHVYDFFLIMSIHLVFLLLLLTLWVYRGIRKDTEKALSQEPKRALKSSDDHWLLGVFYYNPEDKKLLVEKRLGFGSTLNLARPFGKVMMLLTLIVILSSFILLGSLLVKGMTPFSLNLTENNLELVHQKTELSIPLGEIEGVTLLKSLPELRRVYGTSTDNFLEGQFSSGDQRYEVYLSPKNPPFLEVRTSIRTYLLGNKEGEGVEEIYRSMP